MRVKGNSQRAILRILVCIQLARIRGQQHTSCDMPRPHPAANLEVILECNLHNDRKEHLFMQLLKLNGYDVSLLLFFGITIP